MRETWNQLLRQCAPSPAADDAIFTALHDAYSSADRHYHNLEHIRFMLDIVDRLSGEAADLTAVQLATWFHDAVYDSRAKDNEERSADLARALLTELGLSHAQIDHVSELILLTKHHRLSADDRDGAVLIDADLAILGASEAEYGAYAAAIRQEYAWVPEADYRAGRRQVLETFLQRERIYHTALLHAEREAAARRNIRNEVEQLSG